MYYYVGTDIFCIFILSYRCNLFVSRLCPFTHLQCVHTRFRDKFGKNDGLLAMNVMNFDVELQEVEAVVMDVATITWLAYTMLLVSNINVRLSVYLVKAEGRER